VRSGVSTLVGAHGTVLEHSQGATWASVRGERWQVRSASPLAPGDAIRVTGISGLVLEVDPAAPTQGG
jgi:membrane-bound serine protease (ClpP class)